MRLVDKVADGVNEKYSPLHEQVQDTLHRANDLMIQWLEDD